LIEKTKKLSAYHLAKNYMLATRVEVNTLVILSTIFDSIEPSYYEAAYMHQQNRFTYPGQFIIKTPDIVYPKAPSVQIYFENSKNLCHKNILPYIKALTDEKKQSYLVMQQSEGPFLHFLLKKPGFSFFFKNSYFFETLYFAKKT
jgi:serine/threonine protein kinase